MYMSILLNPIFLTSTHELTTYISSGKTPIIAHGNAPVPAVASLRPRKGLAATPVEPWHLRLNNIVACTKVKIFFKFCVTTFTFSSSSTRFYNVIYCPSKRKCNANISSY